MSEHHDLIRQLESFEIRGDTMTPTPPSEVRRLGDRRRTRRRTTALVAASVVAVLAVGIPVALTRDGDPDGSRNITHTPSSTPAPSVTEPTHPVITYPGEGIQVVTDADVQKLTGTTAAFRAFIAGQAQRAVAAGAACPDAFHGITVRTYSSEGYALGGYNDCGGYIALWVDRDDVWQEGMGTQDAWDCDTLAYLNVPTSFVGGECSNEAGGFGPDDVNGLRLGMTQAQVEDLGGVIEPGAPGMCRGVQFPYLSPVANQTDGWFSPSRDLVFLSARPGMKTPERIGLGSSRAAVEAAYPNGRLQQGYWVVPLEGGNEYEFGIEADGTVGEAILTRSDQDCTQ